jgi:hypothetical protein
MIGQKQFNARLTALNVLLVVLFCVDLPAAIC